MKSFARPAFLRDSLGYVRYYDFIRPKVKHRYSLPFPLWDFRLSCLSSWLWFSCSLFEPSYRSCPLNAVCRIASKQVFRYTLSLGVALPLDFGTVKVIFDTSIRVHLRSTPITTPYNSSSYKRWQCFDLVAQYHTVKCSTTRRFGNNSWKSYPIVQFFIFLLSVRPPSLPVFFGRQLVSCRLIKSIISNKVMLPFQRTYLSLYPVVTQDTQLGITGVWQKSGFSA